MATCSVTADCSNLRINATNPATPQTRQDTNSGSKYVMTYTASTQRAHGSFVIPPNYLTGNVVVRCRFRCPSATSGAFTLTGEFLKFVDGTGITSNGTTLVSSSTTVAAGANQVFEGVLTLSSILPTAGVVNWYAFRLSRTTTDTVSGDVDLLDYDVEYTFDPSIQKQYTWLPANVWLALAGSPSTFGGGATVLGSSNTVDPYSHRIPDSTGNKLGVHVQLPSTYVSALAHYIIWANGSNTGSVGFGMAMGNAAVGASYDATLTADTWTQSVGGASSTVHITSSRNAPITASASDMLSLQFTRDSTDANTSALDFYGVLLEYNVFTASPCPIIGLSPECWSAPSSNAASLLGIADTNNSGYVQRFTQGVDQHCEAKRIMPGIYVSGGTFRGFLRTTASSGTIKMRIDYGNPAINSSSDPTLTTGTVINVPVTGAGLLLQFAADITSGLLASDEVILSMYRIGSSDGVTADVDYVEGQVEVGVGA